MKKIITMAYLSAAVLGATMTFSSCSNDNNDNNGNDTPNTVVNPKTVFTGGLPKSVAGMTIQTNDKGQVSAIQAEDEKITFEYIEPTTRAANSPNVIMTVENSEEKLVCNLFLNKNGFVTHCDGTTYYKYKSKDGDAPTHETWDFTYNKDGQLLTMFRSDDNEKTNITYENGDIVSISNEWTGETEKDLYKVYYTSPSVSSPIPNKGCLMFYDSMLHVDMDEMEYAYYAGVLGKATKNLPVRIDNGNHIENFPWKLNSAGYPISLTDGKETWFFVW